MTHKTSTTAAVTSDTQRETLEQQGFTPEQIRRLEALREVYPVAEFVESNDELQRLLFLKWRYQHQQVVA